MKTTLEQVHDLEKKVDDLNLIIESLTKRLENFIDHYNDHTHIVVVGEDSYRYGKEATANSLNNEKERFE